MLRNTLEEEGSAEMDGPTAERNEMKRPEVALWVTRAVLVVNGEDHTCWNLRKRALTQLGVASVHDELAFTRVLLSKHTKSGEAWAHRKWAIQQLLDAGASASVDYMKLCAAEVELCERVALLYPKNYYCWTHRQWAVKTISPAQNGSDEVDGGGGIVSVLGELQTMQGYVARHVGDHAGFHYYEWILMRIVDYFSPPPLNGGAPLLAHLLAGRTATTLDGEGSVALPPPPPLPQAVLDVWRGAWARSTQLLDTYGEHETIWQHRRFMAGALLVLLQWEQGNGAHTGVTSLIDLFVKREPADGAGTGLVTANALAVEELTMARGRACRTSQPADKRRLAAAYYLFLIRHALPLAKLSAAEDHSDEMGAILADLAPMQARAWAELS